MTEQQLAILIEGCLRDERKSQEELYRNFYAYGTTVALHYTQDVSTAKSIYNEAMFKVFKNIAQYNATAGFKSWLRRIIINSAIDYNRKYCQETLLESEEAAVLVPTKSVVENWLGYDDILSVIHRLPPSYRTVFLLHNIEGYKFIEIATQLNITEGGAKTLYHKAKLKLQHILADYFLK